MTQRRRLDGGCGNMLWLSRALDVARGLVVVGDVT